MHLGSTDSPVLGTVWEWITDCPGSIPIYFLQKVTSRALWNSIFSAKHLFSIIKTNGAPPQTWSLPSPMPSSPKGKDASAHGFSHAHVLSITHFPQWRVIPNILVLQAFFSLSSFLDGKDKNVYIKWKQLLKDLEDILLTFFQEFIQHNAVHKSTTALLQMKSFKGHFFQVLLNLSSCSMPKSNSTKPSHRGPWTRLCPEHWLYLGRCSSDNFQIWELSRR